MPIEPARHLHLMTGKRAAESILPLDFAAFSRKFPGNHTALVRPVDRARVESTGFFAEVMELDLGFMQKCAFSPLYGDDTAFSFFQEALAPFTDRKWERVFNLSGSGIDTAIAGLLDATSVVGPRATGNATSCAEAPLKLSAMLGAWGLSDPTTTRWLTAKALSQLDWTEAERSLAIISSAKSARPETPFKNLVVAWHSEGEGDNAARERLARLFTVVELAPADPTLALFADFTVGPGRGGSWESRLTPDDVHPDVLPERLESALPRSLRKWACLSFLFDYLGNPRMALAAEKILTKYDREALRPFLLQEVLGLRDFTKALLGGVRRPENAVHSALEEYWQCQGSTLAYVSAVELSLQPSISPLVRGEHDVAAVRQRLRGLNQFYERIHRATTLEIPKTDLALTL